MHRIGRRRLPPAKVPLLPCTTVTAPGLALRLKFGVPAQPGKLKEPIAVLQLNPPFCPDAFKYSCVNQNVQSSVGSIVPDPYPPHRSWPPLDGDPAPALSTTSDSIVPSVSLGTRPA